MKIELSDETISDIIKQELKDTYIIFKIDLDRFVKTRKGSGYVEEFIWLNYTLVIINTTRK